MYEILILLNGPGEFAYIVNDLEQDDMVGFSGSFRCRCCCEDEVDRLMEICHKDSSYERHAGNKAGFSFTIADKERGGLMVSFSFKDENEREDQIAAMKQYLPTAEVYLVERSEEV